jgi:hypothetical protein
VRAGIVAVDARRATDAPRDGGFATRCGDHGLQAVREHPRFRGLHEPGQSTGDRGDVCGLGRVHTATVYTRDHLALGPGEPDGARRRVARADEYLDMSMHVGRRYRDHESAVHGVGVGVSVRPVRPLITVHFFPGAVSCEPEADAEEPAELSIG